MGGGKGVSSSTTNSENQIASALTTTADTQSAESSTLFNQVGLPGLETAQAYYNKLSSGDPLAIQQAVGPAAQQINAQTAGTVQNIQQSTPPGGVKLLAEDEAKISGQQQIGNLTTQAYTSSFPAEAQLGSGSTGLSINEISQAIAGFSGAGQQFSNIANQEASGKATQLGFFGALAGAGAQGAAAFA